MPNGVLPTPRSPTEQRATPRRAIALRCRALDAAGVERFTRLADLGRGGARIVTASPPPVGSELELRFLAGTLPIEASGRIVWRSEGFRGRGGVIGVVFTRVSDPEALRDFLEAGP